MQKEICASCLAGTKHLCTYFLQQWPYQNSPMKLLGQRWQFPLEPTKMPKATHKVAIIELEFLSFSNHLTNGDKAAISGKKMAMIYNEEPHFFFKNKASRKEKLKSQSYYTEKSCYLRKFKQNERLSVNHVAR